MSIKTKPAAALATRPVKYEGSAEQRDALAICQNCTKTQEAIVSELTTITYRVDRYLLVELVRR